MQINLRDELAEISRRVNSRAEFEEFLNLLVEDLFERSDEWENPTLERYLDALHAFVGSLAGYYNNLNEEVDLENPTWNMFARALFAASIYE